MEIWRRQNILRYFPTTGLFFCWFLKVISLCWFPPSFCLSMIREYQFSLNPITQKCLLGTSKKTPCIYTIGIFHSVHSLFSLYIIYIICNFAKYPEISSFPTPSQIVSGSTRGIFERKLFRLSDCQIVSGKSEENHVTSN